jgi:hypothetical protein
MGSGCTVAFFVPPKRSRVRPPIYTTVWDVTGGTSQLWEEIQENFDLNLARFPEYGTNLRGKFWGLRVLAPSGPVLVIYRVDDQAERIDLLAALPG